MGRVIVCEACGYALTLKHFAIVLEGRPVLEAVLCRNCRERCWSALDVASEHVLVPSKTAGWLP